MEYELRLGSAQAEVDEMRSFFLGLCERPSFRDVERWRSDGSSPAYRGHREIAWARAVQRAREKDEADGRYQWVRLLQPHQGGQPGDTGKMLRTDAKFAARAGVAEIVPDPESSTTGLGGAPSMRRVTAAGLCTSIERLQRP